MCHIHRFQPLAVLFLLFTLAGLAAGLYQDLLIPLLEDTSTTRTDLQAAPVPPPVSTPSTTSEVAPEETTETADDEADPPPRENTVTELKNHLRFRYARLTTACLISGIFNGSMHHFLNNDRTAYVFQNEVTAALRRLNEHYLSSSYPEDALCRGARVTGQNRSLLLEFGNGDILDKVTDSPFYLPIKYRIQRESSDYEYHLVTLGFPDLSELTEIIEEQQRAIPSQGDFLAIPVFTETTDPVSYAFQLQNPTARDVFMIYSDLSNRPICEYSDQFDGPQKREDLQYHRIVTRHSETTGVMMFSRHLELVFLDIENVGDEPIRIDSIKGLSWAYEPNSFFALRGDERDSTAGESFSARIPFEVLAPGEHLLIPQEFGLGPIFGEFDPTMDVRDLDLLQTALETGLSDTLEYSFIWPFYPNDLSASYDWQKSTAAEEVLLEKLDDGTEIKFRSFHLPRKTITGKPRIGSFVRDRLPFGPKVTTLTVSGNTVSRWADEGPLTVNVREPDWTEQIVSGLVEWGSCPYVYTRTTAQGEWTREGRVLTNFVGSESAGTDVMRLARFNGEILIAELEDEESFIDHVAVTIIMSDGKEFELTASDDRLKGRDGKMLALRKGEHFVVSFSDVPDLSQATLIFLRVTGYYELRPAVSEIPIKSPTAGPPSVIFDLSRQR